MRTKTKNTAKTYTITILGIVQGVGFRPFIYNLASSCGYCGNVINTSQGVVVNLNATKKEMENFLEKINRNKPKAAHIENIEVSEAPLRKYHGFRIEKSRESRQKFQLVSPDLATCTDCLEDIRNKQDQRRYGYPFTNCTNCGPRFTIIKKLPYDRAETTMDGFTMCSSCAKEYQDKTDRRFHAQPVACANCGPQVWLEDQNGTIIDTEEPIKLAAEKIKGGSIAAIKGLGGFQIACDATSSRAVRLLRSRKARPDKPLAVMVGSLFGLDHYYHMNEMEKNLLHSPQAPIVLLSKKKKGFVAQEVSFYHAMEGVMLPYTPIHHLLFDNLDIPLVMTSGNHSREPIASENVQAHENLDPICDYFLMHNRDIYSRYDDSLVKVFQGKEMVLRRARGYAPYPVTLGLYNGKETILALGAQEKNTFCLLKKNYAIVSQHLGDLDDMDSAEFFKQTLGNYRKLFHINDLDGLVYDKHPLYTTTKFAQDLKSRKKTSFQHHQCHIASVVAENRVKGKVLGFAWDGTGYGTDGKIWGSEIFVYEKGQFARIGHLTEKRMPGGEITIKKPYRMAIGYLACLYPNLTKQKDFPDFVFDNLSHYRDFVHTEEIKAIAAQMQTGFNSPWTTSMGRLFDAVSSALGLTHQISFEGQAAMHLESAAFKQCTERYQPAIEGFLIDDIKMFRQIVQDVARGISPAMISAKFHNCLAFAILEICKKAKKKFGTQSIALSGGVFQNHLLLDQACTLLGQHGFRTYTNFKVPVNDGGISLGQAYLAALKGRKET